MRHKVLFIEDPFASSFTHKNRQILAEQFECIFPYIPSPNIDALLKKYDDKNLIDPRELADAATRPIRDYAEAIQEINPDVVVAEGFGCYFLLAMLFEKTWVGASVILSPTHIDQYNLEGSLDIPPVVCVCNNDSQKYAPEITKIAQDSKGTVVWANSSVDSSLKNIPHILSNSVLTAYDLERDSL